MKISPCNDKDLQPRASTGIRSPLHSSPSSRSTFCRYGLYASRTKVCWNEIYLVAERVSEGWKSSHPTTSGTDDRGYQALSENEVAVDIDTLHTWLESVIRRKR